MTHRITSLGLGLLMAGAAGHAAAEMPAVSSPHLEIDASAGFLGEDTLYTGGIILAAPIGDQFGVQFDALGGYLTEDEPFNDEFDGDDTSLYGAGIQGFWRSPNLGKIGFRGAYLGIEDVVDIARLGVTAERFLGPIGIFGELGYEYDDITDGGVYANLGMNAYIGDNLKLSLSIYGNSHEYEERFVIVDADGNATTQVFEFSPEVQGEGLIEAGLWRSDVSVYLKARGGNEMDFTTQLGVRWEIGSRWKHLRGSDRGDNTPNQLGSIAAASERLVRSGRIIRQIPSNCSIVTDITNALIGGSPLDQITVPVDEAIVCPIDDAAFDGALDGNTPNPLPGGLTP